MWRLGADVRGMVPQPPDPEALPLSFGVVGSP
jgi:hypothetical protein